MLHVSAEVFNDRYAKIESGVTGFRSSSLTEHDETDGMVVLAEMHLVMLYVDRGRKPKRMELPSKLDIYSVR